MQLAGLEKQGLRAVGVALLRALHLGPSFGPPLTAVFPLPRVSLALTHQNDSDDH